MHLIPTQQLRFRLLQGVIGLHLMTFCSAWAAANQIQLPREPKSATQQSIHTQTDFAQATHAPNKDTSAKSKPHHFRQFHMGMPVELTIYHHDTKQAQKAARAAFKRISALDQTLSDWNPQSELNRASDQANQSPGTAVAISRDLFIVLEHALSLAQATDGAFDPTALPVIKLWREARKSGIAPNSDAIAAALKQTHYQAIQLDHETQSLIFSQSNIHLDLGGIAKGYIGDQVIHILKAHDCPASLYVAGGDIVVGDAPPITTKKTETTKADTTKAESPKANSEQQSDPHTDLYIEPINPGWEIDPTHYADPSGQDVPILYLANQAASISGDTVQYVVIDGVRYSHVIDPRTGMAITTRRMCVVVADKGIDTDGLATTGTLIKQDAFEKLIKQYQAQSWTFTAQD